MQYLSRWAKVSLIVLLLVIPLELAVIYFLLEGRTFYADLVASKVGDAFHNMGGYELKIDDLTGNPITGVDGRGVSIVHGGEEIATADGIEMRLDLGSVLSSPKLSTMRISGLSVSYDVLMRHLPPKQQESSGPPALARLVLENADVDLPWGGLLLRTADVELGDGRYDVELEGSFENRPLSFAGSIRSVSGATSLSAAQVKFGGTEARLDGVLVPSADLRIDFSGLDMAELAELLPAAGQVPLSGVYSGSLLVNGADGIAVSGSLNSGGGQVWLLPFERMDTTVAFDGKNILLNNIHLRALGGELSGDAGVLLVAGGSPELDLHIAGRSLDIAPLHRTIPGTASLSGGVRALSADLSGPANALKGVVTAESELIRVTNYDVSSVRAKTALNGTQPMDVSLNATALGAKVSAAGKIALQPEISLNIDAQATPIDLAKLAKEFPQLREAQVEGEGTASAKITGPVSNIKVEAVAEFPQLTAKGHVVQNARAEALYSRDGLSLKEARVVWNGAELTAAGGMKNAASGRGTLDFKGGVSNLRLASLREFVPQIAENDLRGTVSGSWKVEGSLDDPAVAAELKLPQLAVGNKITLGAVAASVRYRAPVVDLAAFSVRYGKASLSGAGSVTLPSKATPLEYNVKGSFAEVLPAEFVKAGLISADLGGKLAGDIRVWKEGSASPSVRVFFKDSQVVYSNVFDVSDIRGGVSLIDGDLIVDNLRTQVNTGSISLNGKVGNVLPSGTTKTSMEKMPIDMKASVASADIGRISRLFIPTAKGYQGIVTGNAQIGGTLAAPRFSGGASLFGVRAFGLFLPIVRIQNISGSMEEIKFPQIRAVVGRGFIDAKGSLKNNGRWKASVSATGKSVDIRSLTYSLDDQVRDAISGTLYFDFEGNGWVDSFEGHGEARIPCLTAMGLTLTDLKAPFWVSEGFVMVEDSSAKAYGGAVSAQMAKDIKESNWGGRVKVSSADVERVMKDLMPDSVGTITGSADLTLRIAGDTARTSMQDGSGSLEVVNGEISGFPGTEAVSKVIGGRPLRFQSALFSFSLDGRTLTFLPGSRVSAPSGDPVFKYITLDGNVGISDREFDLYCVGNVNIRALNSFVNGLQGLMNAAMTDSGNSEEMLQNFLGDMLTGYSKNEFREVELTVRGTPERFGFEKFVIKAPIKFDATPEQLSTPTGSKEKDMERIRLKLEFPVGPGGGGNGNNVGGQVFEQALDQALKGLIFSD